MSSSKTEFRTANIQPQKFVALINPDTQIKGTDGILTWNTGIYGSKFDNAMPDLLIDLFQNGSAVHQNLVNLKSNLILGNNLQAEDDTKSAQLDPFIARRNKAGDNLKTVYGKASKDMALFNGCVLQVIYNRNGEIAEVYHIPTQDFRLGTPNKFGQIEWGYLSKNWGWITNSIEQRRKESVRIRMWSPDLYKKYPAQLLYLKDYSYSYYAIPAYMSAINWIMIDREISNFHLSNIKSNFFISLLLTQIKGNMSDEMIDENVSKIENFYSGASGRKVLLSYVDDMNNAPKIDKISGTEQDKLFDVLQKQCYQSLITAHNSYPILGGVDTTGADLGGAENRLNTALMAFNGLVCEGMKQIVVDGFNRILEINKLPALSVTTEPLKLTSPIPAPDDLSHNERRAWLYGLPEDDNTPPSGSTTNNVSNPNQIPS
jgi:hypothetical protein